LKHPFNSLKTTVFYLVLAMVLTACNRSSVFSTITLLTKPPQENTWWTPKQGQSWQIQYTGEIDLDMDADIYNLDLFETPTEDIQALHARGVRVLCYINAGAWEDWRPDRDEFPEGVLGEEYEGWPGERWLDIRRIDLLAPIMTARLGLCAQKGFDGVDPDNLDGYTNQTGFPLTAEDQLAYNRWLAEAAHQQGLAIGLKNDPDQVGELVTLFDWMTVESCFYEGWCDQVTSFIKANKPVFAIEYTDNGMQLSEFCDQAASLSIDAILKHRSLDAWREDCP
jgi:endo-alpha-1,4-polygalactosaminidase (GH114 family)